MVDAVRAAARVHAVRWEALVPDRFAVNSAAEADEEAAFAVMAAAKQRLQAHIRQTYGVSVDELVNLATV